MGNDTDSGGSILRTLLGVMVIFFFAFTIAFVLSNGL